jgi:ATP-binding cassette subfamily B protein
VQTTFNPKTLAKKVKAKSLPSNIYSSINILCGLIPLIVVIVMVGLLMEGGMDTQKFSVGAAAIIASLVLKALFYGLSIWKAHDAAYGMLANIRLDMIAHMKKMPISFFQKRKTGDLINIMNHDVEQVEVTWRMDCRKHVSNHDPPQLYYCVLIIDWRLGLALISTLPFIVLMRKGAYRLWGKIIKEYSDSTRKCPRICLNTLRQFQ